ncbi:MAG: polysaccharide deacetylase family protein [Pseudomonadota bacterium]
MSIRDLTGYAGSAPDPKWPGDARIALQFVLNVEEGAESSVQSGDSESESYLHELPGRPTRIGGRDWSVEGMYEYGSRAGAWRLLKLFNSRGLPLTAFAAGQALELNPALAAALHSGGHEIAGHGYRWINYRDLDADEEHRHILRTFDVIKDVTGDFPCGWYTGRVSDNTRRLLLETGKLLYSSDAYNDDLPYYLPGSPPHLIIPYTLVNNDISFLQPHGVGHGEDFFQLLKGAFDLLWQEGARSPKMMNIGLHGRISGHPARAIGVAKFLDYVQSQEGVWICRRDAIARHWLSAHPKA